MESYDETYCIMISLMYEAVTSVHYRLLIADSSPILVYCWSRVFFCYLIHTWQILLPDEYYFVPGADGSWR